MSRPHPLHPLQHLFSTAVLTLGLLGPTLHAAESTPPASSTPPKAPTVTDATQPASSAEPIYRMDPEMMRRYGLLPPGELPPSRTARNARTNVPGTTFQMDPVLMRRYGLVPNPNLTKNGRRSPSPATQTPEDALSQGLFEEEGNRNPTAALPYYQNVVERYEALRAPAGSALFRLGESFRKLNRTNDAAAVFQRIIREFSDREDLVKLSHQNLVGLGITPSSLPNPSASDISSQTAPNSPNPASTPARRDLISDMVSDPNDLSSLVQLPAEAEIRALEQKLAFIDSKLKSGTAEEQLTAISIALPDPILEKCRSMIKNLRLQIESYPPQQTNTAHVLVEKNLLQAYTKLREERQTAVLDEARFGLKFLKTLMPHLNSDSSNTNPGDGSPTPVKQVTEVLNKVAAVSDPAHRSRLIRHLFRDSELKNLWTHHGELQERLLLTQSKVSVPNLPSATADAEALRAAEVALAQSMARIIDHENELVRTLKLRIELQEAPAASK